MTPGTFSFDSVSLDFHPSCGYALLMISVIYCDLDGRLHRACVGMPTDGLTIPRFFYRVAGAPFLNKRLQAAIIHDHYCYKAQSLPAGKERNALRKSGDNLFREMCKVLGDNNAQAFAYWTAVRSGAMASRKAKQIPDYVHERAEFMKWYEGKHRKRK
jgi:hypothetical protein